MTHEQNVHIAQAVQMLTAQLGAAKVLSSGPAYDEARQVWNAAVTRRPAVIVRCESTGDVQSSIRAARTCGLSLSVRGGGHDWAGRALQGELVVHLTRMRPVSVETRVATVGGGRLLQRRVRCFAHVPPAGVRLTRIPTAAFSSGWHSSNHISHRSPRTGRDPRASRAVGHPSPAFPPPERIAPASWSY